MKSFALGHTGREELIIPLAITDEVPALGELIFW